jgi:TolB-like protein
MIGISENPPAAKKTVIANADGLSSQSIREQLRRIVANPEFVVPERLKQLLRFLIEETLAGRTHRLKGYNLAVEVLGRDEQFDPQTDPIVRVEVGRLRRAMQDYYQGAGSDDPVHIKIPKGCYIPIFSSMKKSIELLPTGHNNTIGHLDASKSILAAPAFLPTIAVLPLLGSGSTTTPEHFADGLSNSLVLAFTHYRGVHVIAHRSAGQFKDQLVNVRDIGQRLGARYILDGSVHHCVDMVRVIMHLTDAQTGMQLWAEHYDYEMTVSNVFSLQEEIACRVAALIADDYGVICRNLIQESCSDGSLYTSSYEAVLHGRHYLMTLTSEHYWRARKSLERAVEINPTCVMAWVELAIVYVNDYAHVVDSLPDALEKAEHCARKAVSLDPMCQSAHAVLALVHFQRNDRVALLEAAERALALRPESSTAVAWVGHLMAQSGEWERGLAVREKALRFKPYYPGWLHTSTYYDHFRKQDYQAALAEARKCNMPGFFQEWILRAAALGQLGQQQQAHDAVQSLLKLRPDFPAAPRRFIAAMVVCDDLIEQTLEGLRKAKLPL